MNDKGYFSLRLHSEQVYLSSGSSYYINPPQVHEVIVSQIVLQDPTLSSGYVNVLTTYGCPVDGNLVELNNELGVIKNEVYDLRQRTNDYSLTITHLSNLLDYE